MITNTKTSLRKSPAKIILLLIAALFLLYELYAYTAVFRIVSHTFAFGSFDKKENQDIYILNYRYGDNKNIPSRPADWQLASGKIPQFNNMGTFDPPADSLYVKWKVISTGMEYENTVDLKSSLPWNMNGKTVYFNIEGAQLNVYVIEGITSAQLHMKSQADCPPKLYNMFKCSRIYPDHWKNF